MQEKHEMQSMQDIKEKKSTKEKKERKIALIGIGIFFLLVVVVYLLTFGRENMIFDKIFDEVAKESILELNDETYYPSYFYGEKEEYLGKTIEFGEEYKGDGEHLNPSDEPLRLTSFEEISKEIVSLEDYYVILMQNDEHIYVGDSKDFQVVDPLLDGEYDFSLEKKVSHVKLDENSSNVVAAIDGFATYDFTIEMDRPFQVTTDKESYKQGDLVVVEATGLGEADVKTNLISDVVFYENISKYTAYVGVDVTQKPGEYYIEISNEEESSKVEFDVIEVDFPQQYLTVASSVVEDTMENEDEIERFSKDLEKVLSENEDKLYATSDFILPVSGVITTEFGTQRFDLGRTEPRWHLAYDIGGNATGTPIVAPNAGKVVMADHYAASGNTIIIDHGFGLKSVYMHLDRLDVEVGDKVELGEQIGTVGTTGYSTGPHLHYGIMASETYFVPPGY